jgi:hypothetical protein
MSDTPGYYLLGWLRSGDIEPPQDVELLYYTDIEDPYYVLDEEDPVTLP